MKRLMTILAVSAMTMTMAAIAPAADAPPSATLALREGSVAAGIGWSWGRGKLNYKGVIHEFKVDGLSVGEVGITSASADGKVFGLTDLANFNGTYVSVATEATVGLGAGATAMKNEHGVVIHLYPTTKGVNVKLAGEGVKLTLIN